MMKTDLSFGNKGEILGLRNRKMKKKERNKNNLKTINDYLFT